MQTPTHRFFVTLTVIYISMTSLGSCQSKTVDPQTDSVCKLAIHYLNTNNPDIVYQLTNQKVRKQVMPNFWTSFYKKNYRVYYHLLI